MPSPFQSFGLFIIVCAIMVCIAGCLSPGTPAQPVSPAATPKDTPLPSTVPLTITKTPATPRTTTATPTPTPTPTPSPTSCARPATGYQVIQSTLYGTQYLTIDNQNEYDAVITLRESAIPPESGRKFTSYYLRANDQYTFSSIPPGSYTLWYKLGECWDPAKKQFSVNKGARRFEEMLDYDYSTAGYSAKIYGVVGGNAPTTGVPADQV